MKIMTKERVMKNTNPSIEYLKTIPEIQAMKGVMQGPFHQEGCCFTHTELVLKHIQDKFMEQGKYSDKGAWAAAQLLVTVDYNFVLEAMPAFPSDSAERHDLVADLLEAALRR
jgi:hypothetical protein